MTTPFLSDSSPIRRVFAVGFPGPYGGAATEFHDQILAWQSLGIEVNLLPTASNYRFEYLYNEMVASGVIVHPVGDFGAIRSGDPVFGFCNPFFLRWLPEIRKQTRRTVFVNCMTWLSDMEKRCMAAGSIALFLYQNPRVMAALEPRLREINPDPSVKHFHFKPYFHAGRFSFHTQRDESSFGCGRISRRDPGKYSAKTLQIYEYFVAPKPKRGYFLGFDQQTEDKIGGKPFDWIQTARDQRDLSQADFYRHCEIILQPSDLLENWPRIGLEAMASGSVLIVDNRGGWRDMIEHGRSGWLCNHERDFIYYASRMAYEPELRAEISRGARERGQELAGREASESSWREVFELLASLPE